MNSKHIFAISIVAAGLIWSGGPATASDSGKELASGGGMSSASPNSEVFSGMPDPNSPGGTKDAGKGNGESTGEPSGSSEGQPSETVSSSDSSSGEGSSGSSSNRRGSGNASDDMKADQAGESQDEHLGDKQVDKGMKEGESQYAKAIKGEVVRIEGDHYYVKGQDGKEVRLHIDQTTKMTDKKLDQGELIEATVNEQNHVLSIQSPDRRNDHNLESGQAVELR